MNAYGQEPALLALLAVSSCCVTHLGQLHLLHEAGTQVLQHDAIGLCEEGQDVADEVLLIGVERLPVLHVVAEVNLLGCIQRSHVQQAL